MKMERARERGKTQRERMRNKSPGWQDGGNMTDVYIPHVIIPKHFR